MEMVLLLLSEVEGFTANYLAFFASAACFAFTAKFVSECQARSESHGLGNTRFRIIYDNHFRIINIALWPSEQVHLQYSATPGCTSISQNAELWLLAQIP